VIYSKRQCIALILIDIVLALATIACSSDWPAHSSKTIQTAGTTPESGPSNLKQEVEHPNGLPAPGRQKDRIVIGATLVNITVTVFDSYGRLISGLSKDNFSVFDDKVKQEISHFSDTDSPVSIGIVFDISSSMKDRIRSARRALKQFVDLSHRDDDLFLIAFNDRPKLAMDFTTSPEDLALALQLAKPEGSTALYDAVYLALEKVQQGRQPKKAILIISDGQDNHSRYSDRELRRRVKEGDVQVYAIGLTDGFSDDLSIAQYGKRVLAQLAYLTGGRAFFPNAYDENALMEVCRRIAVELRRQYTVGFYPSDRSQNTRLHSIEIRLNAPKGVGRLHLSYRREYQSQ